MIAAGNTVTWILPSHVGSPKHYRVRVVSLETITRVNGEPLECAVLSCNRFVPVSQLRLGHVSPPSDLLSRDRSRAQDAPPVALTKPPSRTKPESDSHRGQSATRRADAQPLADYGTCNVLAIDFLNLLVRAFHAGKPTETHAVRSMFQTVANAIRKLKPAHVVFALDGGHKMRSDLLPNYKAHRPSPDPLLVAQKALAETAIRIAGFQAIRVTDWEADDVLGTLAMRYSDTVIASCDKDLLAMTGQATRCRVYHPWSTGQMMTAEEKIGLPAHQVADYLALCGDTSDGIPGVVGIGPKTAVQLLNDYGSLEAIIVAAKLGNIKGATGQRIAAQHEAAFTCRRVVELNTNLALPALEDFSPVALWRNKLQDMRLGSVAAIMESLQAQRFIDEKIHPSERVLSATNLQVEQGEEGDSGLQDCPESARLTDHLPEEVELSDAPEIREPNATADRQALCGLFDSESHASEADNISIPPAISQVSLPVATSPESVKYFSAGFTELRESAPVPGTAMKSKFFAVWKDGSRWLIDPNTHRHTCFTDRPMTEWRIDGRGPIDPKTNAVRGA